MTLDEINARLLAIGRPTFTRIQDAIVPAKAAQLAAVQHAWDVEHPADAAEYRQLRSDGEREQQALDDARRAEANRQSDLAMIHRLAGARIATNLEAPRDEPPMVAARQWLESSEWSLSLYGTKGNGKTFAAARAVLDSGLRPVLWLHSPTACARPLYGPDAQAAMARAQEVPLFVLDEFGAELVSAPYMTWLESVLGVRYARGLRTIITSNLSEAGFKARLGERLSDRLREGRVFESSGPSLRKRGPRHFGRPDEHP